MRSCPCRSSPAPIFMLSITDFDPKGTISEVRVHAGLYLDILYAGWSPNAADSPRFLLFFLKEKRFLLFNYQDAARIPAVSGMEFGVWRTCSPAMPMSTSPQRRFTSATAATVPEATLNAPASQELEEGLHDGTILHPLVSKVSWLKFHLKSSLS